MSDEFTEPARKKPSIRHFPATHPLPDWRNFGVMLRVLLGGNAIALVAALILATDLRAWPARFIELAAAVEPWLLILLGLLSLLRDLLWRLPIRVGQAVVLLLAGALAGGLTLYAQSLVIGDEGSLGRPMLLAVAAALLLLF